MRKPRFVKAEEAAALIQSHSTVATIGIDVGIGV